MKDAKCDRFVPCGMIGNDWLSFIAILMTLDDIKKKREADKNEQRD